MKIYNTLTRRKDEFVPLEPGKVKMYVCGPTVYNYIHIGNARPMIVFDTVRRYFEYKGYEVNYVSNFTDVDDKIIKKAIEEGVDADTISKRYIAECKKDMAAMNVKPATTHPLATEEICGMLDMIETLIEKGYAYKAEDGTVYFRVKKFKDYGKLSHKNLDDLQSGFREIKVTGEEGKEDPADFVLWKPKKEGEPYWESPWCQGRPGWHIECSAMVNKYLGPTIDIHSGGLDLIFPHHENEIAQSECANGCTFAHYWLHNGFLTIDNEKMSKSKGNFFMVRDAAKEFGYETIRMFMLSAHYRTPLNYSAESLEMNKASLARLYEARNNMEFRISKAEGDAMTAEESAKMEALAAYKQKFIDAMDDDLNTADALSAIFELTREINAYMGAHQDATKAFLTAAHALFMELTGVLNIVQKHEDESADPDAEKIEALIAQRAAAKKEKNFAEADRIRDELAAMGVTIKDTRQGTQWSRA